MRWARKECGAQSSRHFMRPDGRMAMRSESEECKAEGCRKKAPPSTSFWRFSIIGQLQALAGAQTSFEQLRRGQRRALESLQTSASASCKSCCEGDPLRSPFGDAAHSALLEGELIAHLRLATDDVKIFEGGRKQKSAWPAAFIALNCKCGARAKSKNCLLTSFIPGGHVSSHFDFFSQHAIDELMILLQRASTACAGAEARNMKAHAAFLAGDAAAMPKILGFAGRNAASPCRL